MLKRTCIFSVLFLFTIFFLLSCGPDKKAAVDYNDQIIIEQIKIAEDLKFLFDTFEEFDSTDMSNAYQKLSKTISLALDKADNLEVFDNNSDFKNHAIRLFTSYKTVTDNEYKSMIDILNLPDSVYDDSKIAEWDSLNQEAMNKLNKALKEFNDYQKVFAKNYGINLNDSTGNSVE